MAAKTRTTRDRTRRGMGSFKRLRLSSVPAGTRRGEFGVRVVGEAQDGAVSIWLDGAADGYRNRRCSGRETSKRVLQREEEMVVEWRQVST